VRDLLSSTSSHPPRAAHRLALCLMALLAIDIVLAWIALQAGLVFVELIWRAAAARADFGDLIVAHSRQFHTLRWLQGLTWVATAVLFLAWFAHIGGGLRQAAWRWALLLAAVAADLTARALTMRAGSTLDLGHAMLVLMGGQVLAIAAVAVAITMVLTVDARHQAAAVSSSATTPSGL